MTHALNDKAEKIKKIINGTAEKSKETIREIIASSNKHMDAAMDSNMKIVDSIKKQFNNQSINDSVTDTLKSTFGKSIELAEDALDSIINAYTRQMELNVDFNTKLVDAIKDSNIENADKVLHLIHENFEASRQMTIDNTKDILEFYNKHTNLALNFNKKFEDNVNAQIESLFAIQSKGLDKFTTWASEWWKQPEKK
ncbi:MAG TPA: hypothetical protein VII99_01785 [Bacteroidia bacterium]